MIPTLLFLGFVAALVMVTARAHGQAILVCLVLAVLASVGWGLGVDELLGGSALAAANLAVGGVLGGLTGLALRAVRHSPA